MARQMPALNRQIDHDFLRRRVEVEIWVDLGEVGSGDALILDVRSRLPLVLELLR